MKKLFWGLTLLTSVCAQASMLEIAAGIQSRANVMGITINKDGSVTVKGMSVKRGDLTYSIGNWDNTFDATCRLLGFDYSLTGTGLNSIAREDGPKVMLKDDGTFRETQEHGYKIDKVTCFKKGQLKTVVLFDKKDNEDKSSSINSIKYLRGDLTYSIGNWDNTFDATCRLLGFEYSLSGIGLNSIARENGLKVMLKDDGTFREIQEHGYKIDKATCFSGGEPTLIVLVSGNRYMRVIP